MRLIVAIALGLPTLGCSSPATVPQDVPVAQPAPGAVASPGASRPATKKRSAAPVVEPVVIGNVRYEAPLDGKARGRGQNGGDLFAHDAATGALLWTIRVYTIRYAANMEADKQDIFIQDLSIDADGRTLNVTDERGRRFRVDTVTRKVDPPIR